MFDTGKFKERGLKRSDLTINDFVLPYNQGLTLETWALAELSTVVNELVDSVVATRFLLPILEPDRLVSSCAHSGVSLF